jgi:hypothetical protein
MHDCYAKNLRRTQKRTCRLPLEAVLYDLSHRQGPLLSPVTTTLMKKSKSAPNLQTISELSTPMRTLYYYQVEHIPEPTTKNSFFRLH